MHGNPPDRFPIHKLEVINFCFCIRVLKLYPCKLCKLYTLIIAFFSCFKTIPDISLDLISYNSKFLAINKGSHVRTVLISFLVTIQRKKCSSESPITSSGKSAVLYPVSLSLPLPSLLSSLFLILLSFLTEGSCSLSHS